MATGGTGHMTMYGSSGLSLAAGGSLGLDHSPEHLDHLTSSMSAPRRYLVYCPWGGGLTFSNICSFLRES